MTKDKNGENVPPLQVTEVILVYCSIVNNDYQQDSRLLYTFIPNKMFCQLLHNPPKSFMFLKIDSEFSYTELWFTDQNSRTLEIEDKINIILVIN